MFSKSETLCRVNLTKSIVFIYYVSIGTPVFLYEQKLKIPHSASWKLPCLYRLKHFLVFAFVTLSIYRPPSSPSPPKKSLVFAYETNGNSVQFHCLFFSTWVFTITIDTAAEFT